MPPQPGSTPATTIFDAIGIVMQAMLDNSPTIGLTWGIGDDQLVWHANPPRVVWVPADDTYVQGATSGYGQLFAVSNGQTRDPAGPKSLAKHTAGFDVHIWGSKAAADAESWKHLAATLALRDLLVLALTQKAKGSYTLRAGQWLSSGGEGPKTQLGRVYVLRLELDAPVAPDQAVASVTIAQANGTVGLVVPPNTDPVNPVTITVGS